MEQHVHDWTSRNRWMYFISMIPFVAVFPGTAWLLAQYSITVMLIFIGLYLLANIFQAGACVGCPYRGRYCPAIFGVYLGNILSATMYRKREFEPKFFRVNANAAEIMVFVVMGFPVYWLYLAGWPWLGLYVALLVLHVVIFMPSQCSYCSYNETCPGGLTWLACRRWLAREK